MLVLSRKESDRILFPTLGISVEVLRVQGGMVLVAVEAAETEMYDADMIWVKPRNATHVSKIQEGQVINVWTTGWLKASFPPEAWGARIAIRN